MTDGTAAGDDRDDGDDESGHDDPFGDLTDRQRARREEREADDDPFAELDDAEPAPVADATADPDGDDVFEQMDVDPVDEEDVWADLLGEENATTDETVGESDDGFVFGETVAAGDENDTPDGGDESAGDAREEHVIPKADYCEQCEYFSDPPDLACEHEGTDIVSVEDFEHFRVRGCPVVENEFDPDDRG